MGQHNAKLNRLWLVKQYLCQPMFSKKQALILNFHRFAQLQRIRHLERCFQQPYSFARFCPLLEKCWAQS